MERACDALKSAGISKIILVVGYEQQSLIDYALSNIKDIEFEFVYNNDYERTNNIFSLYLARRYLKKDDTILLESDLIYDPTIVKDMVEDTTENLAAVAKYEYWMDGTVCNLDREGNIEAFVDKKDFDYTKVDQYYKTVNIYKFSKEFATSKYIPFLETYINVYGTKQYYESVLRIISHINKMDLRAFDIGDRKWYEIDNAQDFDIASTMFATRDKQLLGYEMHYGGYWRFPKVHDYCYLVNPYFPTDKFVRHMDYMFHTLLTQYPSGQKVQAINASRLFDINEENIVVGNGAAELINILGRMSGGKTVGVTSPVFHEYIRCFANCKMVYIQSDKEDLSISKEKVLTVLPEIDMLVLVNPDNPSGAFLDKADMIDIIEQCHEKGICCVIDESFVDFADEGRRFTLLRQRILDRYPNLIVIKSISKSYGVPGLRLGILATSNVHFISEFFELMAIWNINSFSEFFLEIMPLYKQPYCKACNQLVTERAHFSDELNKSGLLKVFPSQANYVMCEVLQGTSRELANTLIEEYDILIKDLSTKTGIDRRQYIRIAIKSERENNILIDAIRQIGEGK